MEVFPPQLRDCAFVEQQISNRLISVAECILHQPPLVWRLLLIPTSPHSGPRNGLHLELNLEVT